MFDEKCPVCGVHGRLWNKTPQAFVCPKCSSFFTPFGLVLESEQEDSIVWN
jgi:hypothetical protein